MERDCFDKVCVLIIWLFVFLISFSFIPEAKILHITTRKIDLLSDIRPDMKSDPAFETEEAFPPLQAKYLPKVSPFLNVKEWTNETFVQNTFFHTYAKRGFRMPDLNYYLDEAQKEYRLSETVIGELRESIMRPKTHLVAFEDFSVDSSESRMFYDRLASVSRLGRPFRIAFLGDSFIEGDIMTADIRDTLQSLFGGRGVGYVPLASVTAGFRQTIRHQYEGWRAVSIASGNPDWSKFALPAQYFVPDEVATVSYATTNYRKHTSEFGCLRFFFINEKNSEIHIALNGREARVFTPDSAKWLQQVVLEGAIRRVDVSVDRTDGFTALGFFMDDSLGVAVDNYSLRGFSGMGLSALNRYLCMRYNKLVPYDMIILQYGLNVAEKDVLSYGGYREQMVKVVRHLKECFPETAVMLVSVGDRSIKSENGLETMNAIRPMVRAQKQAAEQSQVMFWNLYEAMGGANSMVRYAQHIPPYANKDYTHITHAGGKPLSEAFVAALMSGFRNFLIEKMKRVEEENV